MSQKMKKGIIFGFFGFCILILSFVVGMTIKRGNDAQTLLEESIQSQLLSISLAAREIIEVDDFISYADGSVVETDAYKSTLKSLRKLASETGAEYIYALKKQGGTVIYVFDTDPEDESVFIDYGELSAVHENAFKGQYSAGVMNVQEEWGNFNTGAVPILKDGVIVGIVATDIEDAYFEKNANQFLLNTILLITILALILALIGVVIFILLARIHRIQTQLNRMAHFDKLTDLPNRRFLLDKLAEMTAKKNGLPFALYFIDMDNFKKVNDTAGHDAGDALLQRVGAYLQTAHGNSQVFRPGAGSLNVTARVGGDEFIIVAPGISAEADAETFAKELLDGFRTSEIDKYIEKYDVGLSIGVALYPLHTENYHVLINYADAAMYNAKRGGKNCFRIYADGMHQEEKA